MLKIIPNKKNIGAEIIVNLIDITNKDILKIKKALNKYGMLYFCLLYTSPSPRDLSTSRMPSSA